MKRHGGSSVSCDNAVALLGGMAAAETKLADKLGMKLQAVSNCGKGTKRSNRSRGA
jgi:hypothetical protein